MKKKSNVESTTSKIQEQGAASAAPIKKIAIVGCSDSKDLAPYDDKTWQIWAMNNSFAHVKRQDAWFEIHPIKKDEKGNFKRRKLIQPGVFEWADNFRGQPMEDYIKNLAALNVPIYMQQHWNEIPQSIPYPLAEITSRFGRYFTNSVSYMIALAILDGATDIGCFGVDMATGSEYGPQRPSCEWMLGIAAGLGIRLTIPDQADLLKTMFLYAFEEREQCAWEKKVTQMLSAMEKRKAKSDAIRASEEQKVQQYIGAIEATKEIERIWSNHMTTKIWKDKLIQ
jgi:hypothetical protein